MKYRFIHEMLVRDYEQWVVEAESLPEAWREYCRMTDEAEDSEMLDAGRVDDSTLVEVRDENNKNLMNGLNAWLKDHRKEQ